MEYVQMLASNLDCVKREDKDEILRAIQALMYVQNNPQPDSREFERVVLHSDLELIEKILRDKYL
jgi:hypothetical protein